ncbi:MAG: pentapeptide repeat-containing protein, partial [Pseudomonadota bacterium]
RDANAVGVYFDSANLTMADFSGSDVSQSDFRSANLSGVDFCVRKAANINLSGALYSKKTIWPSWLDPHAAGAILIDEHYWL